MSIQSQEIAFKSLVLADTSSVLRRDSAALIKKSSVLRTLKPRKPAITRARSRMQNCNQSAKG